jgi:hypothetical protein
MAPADSANHYRPPERDVSAPDRRAHAANQAEGWQAPRDTLRMIRRAIEGRGISRSPGRA